MRAPLKDDPPRALLFSTATQRDKGRRLVEFSDAPTSLLRRGGRALRIISVVSRSALDAFLRVRNLPESLSAQYAIVRLRSHIV
jgi:predicted signal transduction protein with EAL and GGDEF domain